MFFQRPKRTYIAGTFIVGASITAVISLGSFIYCWQFVHTALMAEGKVIQMVERQDSEHGTLYTPVFTFRDFQNAEHTIHSSTASYPPEHEVGDSVRVLYAPDDPTHAKTDRFFSLWGWPFVTSLLTAFYLPFGLILWHWPRIARRFRREPPVISAP